MSEGKRGKKTAQLVIKAGKAGDSLLPAAHIDNSTFLLEELPTANISDTFKEPAKKSKKGDSSKQSKKRLIKTDSPKSESVAESTPKQKKSSPKVSESQKPTADRCEEPEQEQKTGERSAKTEQVMRLVKSGKNSVNPVIMAGKSSIPRQLRGVEPLSKILRRESAKAYEDYAERVAVNVTELVIAENAGEILRRFNACDCEFCVAELSRRVSEKVSAKYVKLPRGEIENGSEQLEEIKEPLKKAVLSQMIRELLGNKRRSFHGKSGNDINDD